MHCQTLPNLSNVDQGFYFPVLVLFLYQVSCFSFFFCITFLFFIFLFPSSRIWGSTVFLTKDCITWRQMFLQRPHLRFDGVYICRMTYVRQGEQSYIDQTYKPWYLVEYYRFIRVFPDGGCDLSYIYLWSLRKTK